MASAAALLSPRAAHDQGLDNVNFDFDDLVEWNSTPSSSSSYFNNPFSTLNSNPNSPKSSNSNLNSKCNFDFNSTSSTSANPDSNSSSTSAHNQASSLDETAPSNSETEALFRHHLSLELRKIGSPVNDSILDHYVKQHAQGLARANSASIQQSSSHAATSSSRGNSPPELDPTASASSSSSSSSAASPTFSRRAFSLSPLPEEDQDQDRTAKAFKIHQENDGQFSHFGRSSLGMGIGMTLENSGFENHDHINGGQDSEMSSVDPSSLMINRGGSKGKDQDAMSEVEDGPADPEETLADSKESLSALIAKNPVAEDSSSKQVSSDQQAQATQSSTDNPTSTSVTSLERPPSSFSAFRPPRVGEPPLAPNYAQPSSVRPNLNLNKNNAEDEDETMFTTNAVSLDDPDKPTPEEYKKMSSKEKRQLRNKISARNFRERRKGYIAQLEHEMQERDYTIASLRAQLERVGLQNYELKKEVKNLRSSAAAATGVVASTSEVDAPSKPAQPAAATAIAAAASSASSSGSAIGASISQADVQRILDAFQKSTAATQNQPSLAITSSDSTPRTVPAAIATTTTSSRPSTPSGSSSRRPISPRPIHHSSSSSSLSSSSSIPVPNTRKDAFLSSDGSNSTSSFWAGGRSNSLLGNSGFMSVHTTLLPSISFNPSRIAPSDKKGKSNGGLTFRGLNNHFRSFKAEKGSNAIEKSSLPPPPAYSDHSFCDVKGPEEMNKRESTEEKFDVYDAFASLLRQGSTSQQPDSHGLEDARGDGEVLPSYLESVSAAAASPQAAMVTATPQAQPLSLTDDAVEDRVLEALYKAFSNENSSTSSFYPVDSKTSMAQNQSVDLHKLGALLDGKAELVLVDSETRREWTSQDGGRFGSRSASGLEGIAARH